MSRRVTGVLGIRLPMGKAHWEATSVSQCGPSPEKYEAEPQVQEGTQIQSFEDHTDYISICKMGNSGVYSTGCGDVH